MNRRLRPTALLVLVRRHARRRGQAIRLVPGRGGGSHRLGVVLAAGSDIGSDGVEREVGRFAVAEHGRELSWTVLRGIESGLAPAFGERWLEDA